MTHLMQTELEPSCAEGLTRSLSSTSDSVRSRLLKQLKNLNDCRLQNLYITQGFHCFKSIFVVMGEIFMSA